MSNTSRRAVLIGVAALSAAPAAALASSTDLDRDLRAACAAFDRATEQMRRAGRLMDQISASYEAPPKPAICEPPSELKVLWSKITTRDFEALADDHPLRVWERTTRKSRDSADSAWRAECKRLRDHHGYTAAADAWEQTCDDLFGAFKRVMTMPANSLAGLALKVRVVDARDGENEDYKDGWLSVAVDIRRLQGVA